MTVKAILTVIALSVVTTFFSLTYFHPLALSDAEYAQEKFIGITDHYHPPRVVTALTTGDPAASACFTLNSKKWLNAERLGNVRDDRFNERFLENMIIHIDSLFSKKRDPAKALLNQTLCHRDSSFLSMDPPTHDDIKNPTNATIHMWSLRLIYLATHIHQHLPAIQEAKLRSRHNDQCQPEWASKGVGSFDFECPSAKFLVVSMGRLGLGAVMRLGVVNALVAGIASNRTVVVVNNSPVGPKFLQEPWLLASCPRRDLQCFYMPMTPCVLTREEIANASALERGQARALFRYGQLPDHLADERVLLLDFFLRPQRTPDTFQESIVKIITNHILWPIQQQAKHDSILPILTRAANHILEPEPVDNSSYSYFGHNNKHNHALVFYAMRPNPAYSDRLDEIMKGIIPKNMDPDLTFGVPIRASDKCAIESECLPFHQYMNMTRQTFTKYQKQIEQASTDPLQVKANIIVTSEADQVHDEMEEYRKKESHLRELPFSVQFVSNHYDVHQGTGNPGRTNANISMEEVMLSAISSLKAQLHARYTLGNCCSNFHLLMFDFLRDGCGAAREQVAECMQDHEDPSFRLCCQWSKTDECTAKRVR